jgi:hypothetical protein
MPSGNCCRCGTPPSATCACRALWAAERWTACCLTVEWEIDPGDLTYEDDGIFFESNVLHSSNVVGCRYTGEVTPYPTVPAFPFIRARWEQPTETIPVSGTTFKVELVITAADKYKYRVTWVGPQGTTVYETVEGTVIPIDGEYRPVACNPNGNLFWVSGSTPGTFEHIEFYASEYVFAPIEYGCLDYTLAGFGDDQDGTTMVCSDSRAGDLNDTYHARFERSTGWPIPGCASYRDDSIIPTPSPPSHAPDFNTIDRIVTDTNNDQVCSASYTSLLGLNTTGVTDNQSGTVQIAFKFSTSHNFGGGSYWHVWQAVLTKDYYQTWAQRLDEGFTLTYKGLYAFESSSYVISTQRPGWGFYWDGADLTVAADSFVSKGKVSSGDDCYDDTSGYDLTCYPWICDGAPTNWEYYSRALNNAGETRPAAYEVDTSNLIWYSGFQTCLPGAVYRCVPTNPATCPGADTYCGDDALALISQIYEWNNITGTFPSLSGFLIQAREHDAQFTTPTYKWMIVIRVYYLSASPLFTWMFSKPWNPGTFPPHMCSSQPLYGSQQGVLDGRLSGWNTNVTFNIDPSQTFPGGSGGQCFLKSADNPYVLLAPKQT